MLGIFKGFGYLTLCISITSCATYQNMRPHNKVLTGVGMGGAVALGVVGSSPLALAYVVTGGTLLGTIVGLYELSNLENGPRVPSSHVRKKKLIDQGTGKLSYLAQQDPNLLIDWKLYESGFWIKNSGNQFLYVDKVIDFEPSSSAEKAKQ